MKSDFLRRTCHGPPTKEGATELLRQTREMQHDSMQQTREAQLIAAKTTKSTSMLVQWLKGGSASTEVASCSDEPLEPDDERRQVCDAGSPFLFHETDGCAAQYDA